MCVKISVVVCTFNRADVLPTCLNSLVLQTIDSENYEVVVVDNCSTDTTGIVAERYAEEYSYFKVVSEQKQGHSCARNRGWREAKYPFVAYIDDDGRAYPDWLEKIADFIERNPDVEAFGGPFDAFSDKPLPHWFPSECSSWSLGDVERPIRVGEEFINGTNMVFSQRILRAVGGFNESLGMTHVKIFYGEDTRLVVDIADYGARIFYVPSVKVSHKVAEQKMRLRWLLSSAYNHGLCSGEMFNQNSTWSNRLAGVFIGLSKMLIFLVRPISMPFKKRLYYSLTGICSEWGGLIGFVRKKT